MICEARMQQLLAIADDYLLLLLNGNSGTGLDFSSSHTAPELGSDSFTCL